MAVKEYRCTAHDHEFESAEDNPRCPYGCNPKFVVQEFRTPFSIGTPGAKVVDRLQTQLASDYGLTDMRNDRDASVMSQTRRTSGGMREIGPPGDRKMIHESQVATWAPSLFRPPPGWARTNKVPEFNWNATGLKGGANALIHDKHGAIPAAAPTKPQLDVAKNTLRRQTVIHDRWNGK